MPYVELTGAAPMTHVKMPAYGVSLTQMFLPALSAAGVVV
jgi:hypothetical protein